MQLEAATPERPQRRILDPLRRIPAATPGGVVVPQFGYPTDQQAIDVLQEAYGPGYKVRRRRGQRVGSTGLAAAQRCSHGTQPRRPASWGVDCVQDAS